MGRWLVSVAVLLYGFRALAVDGEAWRYGQGVINSVQALPDGHVVVARKDDNEVIELMPSRPQEGTVTQAFTTLNAPDFALRLVTGETLVTDTENNRILTLSPGGQPLLQLGGGAGCAANDLALPSAVQQLANGHYLIADQNHHRVEEVDAANVLYWSYGSSDCVAETEGLNAPFHVESLPGGDVLLSDPDTCVVRRVRPTPPSGGTLIWEYGQDGVAGAGSNQLFNPTRVHALDNGHVLIADSQNHRVIEVIPTLPSGGTIAWQYGQTGVAGDAVGLLNSPYDAVRLANGDTLITDRSANSLREVSALRLGLSGPSSMVVGACVAVALQIRDSYAVNSAPADVAVSLGVAGGAVALYADASCSQSLARAVVLAQTGEVTLYASASSPGPSSVSASSPEYGLAVATLDPVLPPGESRHHQLDVGFTCGSTPAALGLGSLPLLLVMTSLRRSRRAIASGVLAAVLVSSFAARAEDVEVWTYSGGQFNSVQSLANGDALVAAKDTGEFVQLVPDRPHQGVAARTLGGFSAPDFVLQVPGGDWLVTDTDQNHIYRYTPASVAVWSLGGGSGCGADDLRFPSAVQLLPGGDYLIADQGHARVLEVTAAGAQVWRYGSSDCSSGEDDLIAPFHVEATGAGDVLITDAAAQIVRRVTPTLPAGGTTVWQYGTLFTPGSGTNQLATPTRAHALPNGDVLVADSANDRVLQITPTLPSGGTIVWQYGQTGTPGATPGLLDHPYDATRLSNGDTLIGDHSANGLREVSTLRVALSRPDPLTVGACVPVDVQIRDADDLHPPTPDVPVTLQVSAGDLTVYSDGGCTQPATQRTVPGGTSAVTVWLRATSTASETLVATTAGYSTASESFQPVVPSAPARPDARRLSVGCSSVPGAPASATALSLMVSWLAALALWVGKR